MLSMDDGTVIPFIGIVSPATWLRDLSAAFVDLKTAQALLDLLLFST